MLSRNFEQLRRCLLAGTENQVGNELTSNEPAVSCSAGVRTRRQRCIRGSVARSCLPSAHAARPRRSNTLNPAAGTAGSSRGGERAAAFYSLVGTAKLNGLTQSAISGMSLPTSPIIPSTASRSSHHGTSRQPTLRPSRQRLNKCPLKKWTLRPTNTQNRHRQDEKITRLPSGVVRLIANLSSFVACCVYFQLRPIPSTGITRLHRYGTDPSAPPSGPAWLSRVDS
jgi:hypothetical protein